MPSDTRRLSRPRRAAVVAGEDIDHIRPWLNAMTWRSPLATHAERLIAVIGPYTGEAGDVELGIAEIETLEMLDYAAHGFGLWRALRPDRDCPACARIGEALLEARGDGV